MAQELARIAASISQNIVKVLRITVIPDVTHWSTCLVFLYLEIDHRNRFAMKNALLVPTDFSENAWQAALYAARLATHYKWGIHLLHAYEPLTSAFAGHEFNEAMSGHAYNKATSSIDEMAARLASLFPELPITSACVQGALGKVLPDLATSGNTKFVVMGTQGASGLKGIVLGSNTFEIIQKSPVGVLAVPNNYGSFKLEKIGVLSNFKETEIEVLETFISRTSGALEVVLLHVDEPGKKTDEKDANYWVETVQQRSGAQKISYRIDQASSRLDAGASIPKCIEHLTQEEKIDLLLVSYNRRSFFQQLFSRNLTRSIAYNLTVPAYFHRVE